MKLRYQIPVNFYVSAPESESLSLETSFAHQGLMCQLALVGGDPLTVDEPSQDIRHFRHAERLEISLLEDPVAHKLWMFIEQSDWPGVVQILREVANRCLSGIRNFGVVPSLRELRGRTDENAEGILRRWRVEMATNSEWSTLFPEPEFSAIMSAFFPTDAPQVYGELQITSWSSIEEAIQDDIEPPAELEFTTNAIEHLRLGNLRLSLLESIIGLEIVLTRYLTVYLRVQKKLSNNRIKKFLTPSLGLSARLAAVLDLTLSKSELSNMNLDQVRAAVNWRNSIVHRTGHLPAGLPEQTLREGIGAVLAVADRLAGHADRIAAGPDMENLTAHVADMYDKLPRPLVLYIGNHKIGVQFSNVGFDHDWIPGANEVASIAATIGETRISQDARFEPDKHLRIVFTTFPDNKLRAKWEGGKFETIGQ